MTTASDNLQASVIDETLDTNVRYVNELIGIGTSWDIIAKPFAFGAVRMMSYVANGFFLSINVIVLLQNLETTIHQFVRDHPDRTWTVQELVDNLATHVPFVQVQSVASMDDAVRFILSGPLVTFIEGYNEALIIDTRIYPMRGVEEPQIERVVRGPRDGFTETMLMNTALIRRRLRDPRLRVELAQVGTRSQTDTSLLYLQGFTDPALVENIRNRLKSISVDAIPMAEQAVTELLGKVGWNPYPITRYTERPDVATTALLEGHVVIIVDTSPEAIIAPVTFFQHLQHPQEYHSYPFVGTYMRWVILFAVAMSIWLPGVFILMNQHPDALPKWLSFFRAERDDPLPLGVELVLAEVALDMLRLAVINTPTALASAVSIVAALLLGQFAAKIHLLQPEVLVYMGFVMIAQLATSSFELASANQMARLWILVWTACLGWIGFAISCLSCAILLLCTRSFGVPYLWPLFPFRWRNGLKEVILRRPLKMMGGRPGILVPEPIRKED